MERVSENQFTIFLTFEDLIERGFTTEDLWQDLASVQNLFSDMMFEASYELGIELEGLLLVQVQLMQAQGMHVFVTQRVEPESVEDDFFEMKVTMDESENLLFVFMDFEHVIQVASRLSILDITGGTLYYMDDRYYVVIDESDLHDVKKEDFIAIMSEFSIPSIITIPRLEEYGKRIVSENAVEQLVQSFCNK